MKKSTKIIVLIILAILIVSLSIFFYFKYQQTLTNNSSISDSLTNDSSTNEALAKVTELFNRKNDVPDNVYIKEEYTNNAGTTIEEIYKKGKITYVKDYTEVAKDDIIFDYEKMEYICVHEDGFNNKNIDMRTIDENEEGYTNIVDDYFYGMSEELRDSEKEYKYYGKENIDGIDCIRFSLYDKDSGYLTNYYIDTEKRALYKEETGIYYNDKYTFSSSTKYTFSENTVKDEDILQFDINNYPDYKVTDKRNK